MRRKPLKKLKIVMTRSETVKDTTNIKQITKHNPCDKESIVDAKIIMTNSGKEK